MWKRLLPVVIVIAVISGSHGVTPAVQAADTKPNVLFICIDDLKPLLGCYGDKLVKSPNIDRLAARSVLFESAYCNQAVCAPSRNSLLTGRRPQSLGIYDLGTNFRNAGRDIVTLPQTFKQNGYHTEALGKIFHVGHGNHEDPASWSVPHWQANSIAYILPNNKAPAGLTREEALFGNAKVDVGKLPRGSATESADVADNEYPDGKIADEAIKRLKSLAEKPGEPFFLAVGFLKPHLPFCAPKKYWDQYDKSAFKMPELSKPPQGAPAFAPTSWGELRQYADMPQAGPLTEAQALHLIHGYHAATSFTDAQIGRVLATLDELHLAKNTIIMLWGDHGWHLGDHGMWCKHSNYEQAAHIPLLLSAPGVSQPGTRTKSLAETVDIYPTLCELAGLNGPADLEGKSLVPVLKDPSAKTKDSIIHVYPRAQMIGRAIRTDRYRLVEWKKPGAETATAVFELYDYEQDPLESKNLADAQPEIVQQLQKLLAAHPEAKPQIKAAPKNDPEKKDEAKPGEAKPAVDRAALFEKKDKNHDGKLTKEEFMANQPDPEAAEKRFPLFDTNKDGVLSKEEFIKAGK